MTGQATKIIPIILSGGQGTRLWPMSRQNMPKQFLPFLQGKSLFARTVDRVQNRDLFVDPIVVCSHEHRFLVQDILKKQQVDNAHIIVEPLGRNTAPAMAAALIAVQDLYPGLDLEQAPCLILPADHFIPDMNAFNKIVSAAVPVAQAGKLLTFGITPSSPHTGFGYIQKGPTLPAQDVNAFIVKSFTEKPKMETAQSYLDQGGYYWNAGIFMGCAGVFLEEIKLFEPEMLEATCSAWQQAQTDLGDYFLNKDNFEQAKSISIDYAVMEKTNRASVVEATFEWSDLGSWDAMWDLGASDPYGNVTHGDVVALETKNAYLHSTKQLLCCVGLEDVIIVATDDAIVAAPRGHSEKIKDIVNELKTQSREELASGLRTYRPWGYYEVMEDMPTFKVKRIRVTSGHRLSLQKHKHRSEHWVVVSGVARVTKDEETFDVQANESVYIPQGCVHRLENQREEPLDLIEVQTGTYFGEDDIIRLEDDYKRAEE